MFAESVSGRFGEGAFTRPEGRRAVETGTAELIGTGGNATALGDPAQFDGLTSQVSPFVRDPLNGYPRQVRKGASKCL